MLTDINVKHRIYIFLLFLSLTSCMPEENLPIRPVGDIPDYFIECYCQPGKMFALSATNVLPVAESLKIDFSKEMTVKIIAGHEIELHHTMYTLPGSDFIYNYGNSEKFRPDGLDSLFLSVITADHQSISGSTSIPSQMNIYSHSFEGNEAIVRFYTSAKPDDNYYIYTAEVFRHDSISCREVCYLDYSRLAPGGLTEKSLFLTGTEQAQKILLSLKRITRANYDYQISLTAANSANQSSITTPVPLKGNLKGALGIFSCYSEDRVEIFDF